MEKQYKVVNGFEVWRGRYGGVKWEVPWSYEIWKGDKWLYKHLTASQVSYEVGVEENVWNVEEGWITP